MIEPANKWPYSPPSDHDGRHLSDIYRPPGYVLLSEAIEMMGKITYPLIGTIRAVEAHKLVVCPRSGNA